MRPSVHARSRSSSVATVEFEVYCFRCLRPNPLDACNGLDVDREIGFEFRVIRIGFEKLVIDWPTPSTSSSSPRSAISSIGSESDRIFPAAVHCWISCRDFFNSPCDRPSFADGYPFRPVFPLFKRLRHEREPGIPCKSTLVTASQGPQNLSIKRPDRVCSRRRRRSTDAEAGHGSLFRSPSGIRRRGCRESARLDGV